MEYTVVFESILLIGFMILIGVLLARITPINDSTRKTYTLIIVNVAMPCIILSSIFKVEIDHSILKNIGIVFGLSIIISIVGILIGWLSITIFDKDSTMKPEVALLSGLGNTGFIGIPLCAAILGPKGALYAAIFDAGVDLVIWTFGVMLLQKSVKFSFNTLKSMINIPTIAIVCGLLFAFVNYRPPMIFITLTNQLAALASPLAMFYIGILIMSVNKMQFTALKSKSIIPTLVKLLGLPVVAFIMIRFITLDHVIAQTLLIQATMPALTLSSILFSKYNVNDKLGAIVTVISTIFSLLSIPLLLLIFVKLNYF